MHTIDLETFSNGRRKRRRAIAIDHVNSLSCEEGEVDTVVSVRRATDLTLGMTELSRIRLETETLGKAFLQRDR